MENLAKEVRAIPVHEIEADKHEGRLFFEWLDALVEFSRARNTLEEYRSRKWPWFFSPGAWRARSQKRQSRKYVNLLRRQIEPFL